MDATLIAADGSQINPDRHAPIQFYLINVGTTLMQIHSNAAPEVRTQSELLSLHFFYLNVGTEQHSWLVRVEIPKWVADDPDKLNLLHTVLVDQCRMMGNKPYPYLLHRAHEVAVVKREEKLQVEQMLAQELRRQDEEIGEGSHKQAAKDSRGRMAYKR